MKSMPRGDLRRSGKAARSSQPGRGMMIMAILVLISLAVETAPANGVGDEVRAISPHPGRPLTFFTTRNFTGSGRCGLCHSLLADKLGNNLSISDHWRSTMMANAARDPLWQAKVASEVARHPSLQKVIEAKCVTCHMPMAWTQARATGEGDYGDRAIFSGKTGWLDPEADLHQAAMDGVSCTLCHQILDQDLGTDATFSGKFPIDTLVAGPDRSIFGPFRDPLVETMRTSVEFTPKFGAQVNDSRLCATCHTLYTPFVDREGKVAGEFPEQTVYLEWQHSAYYVSPADRREIGQPGPGRLCQECHMPHSETGEVMIARYAPPETEKRDHFSMHHFVGGNVFMLGMLRDNVSGLGLTASTGKLEKTMERTLRQLRDNGGGLTILEARRRRDTLQVVVQVENKAGHKFPGGIPIRRAWLHVTVTDGAGGVIFESGRPLADGLIEGNGNDENSAAFEPHYEVITDPGQVQIYEAIMADTDDAVTYTLLRAARYIKDNRLLPRGFDKATAPPDVAVYGGAATDEDFVGGGDRIAYMVPLGDPVGPLTVRAELLFSAVTPAFVRDLARDRNLALVNRFDHMYEGTDKSPVIVATAGATVQ